MTQVLFGPRLGREGKLRLGCSAAVLDAQGRILLTRRTDNGLWYLPGGAAEPGASESEACQRAKFSEFFGRESCGISTPCRAGNFILTRKIEKIRRGLGTLRDLVEIQQWGHTIKQNSRCDLGQTSPNSILEAIQKFPEYFEGRVDRSGSRLNRGFDLDASVAAYDEATGI